MYIRVMYVGTYILVTSFGHGPVVTVPWDNLGPTKSPLNVPPVMIVNVTPHSSPLTVTLAIPLVIGVLPGIRIFKIGYSYIIYVAI